VKIVATHQRRLSHVLNTVLSASNYDGVNVLRNLNEPVGSELFEKYDCVFNGGLLEHVFNFPVALKNCLEMVKVGGHFITITLANAQFGHGFYQFSPELFYSALCARTAFWLNSCFCVSKPVVLCQKAR